MSILISGGHNPKQKGACNNGTCEYELATDWVEYIKKLIKPFINVSIVPTGTLPEKVSYINSVQDCRIAIELHFNSNVKAKGSETLYHPNSKLGKELADCILEEFETANIFQPNRGSKIGYYKMDENNPIDYFLRKTKPVSVIIEPDFIYNLDNIKENKELGCRAIADALIKFYHRHYIND